MSIFCKLLGFLLLELSAVASYQETVTNLNRNLTTPTWPFQRDEIDFGNPFESPPDTTKRLKAFEADLGTDFTQPKALDPSILEELQRTNGPITTSFVDENGFNHTTTYTRNPVDSSVNKLQTGRIALNELRKQGGRIAGVGVVPVEELLSTRGSVNKTFENGSVKQQAVFRAFGSVRPTAVDPDGYSMKESDEQIGREITTTTRRPTHPHSAGRDADVPSFSEFVANSFPGRDLNDGIRILQMWQTGPSGFITGRSLTSIESDDFHSEPKYKPSFLESSRFPFGDDD